MSFTLALTAMFVQAPSVPPIQPPPPNPTARVCRKVPAATGSRLGVKRECRSAREWAAIDAENNRDIDQMRRRTGRQNY